MIHIMRNRTGFSICTQAHVTMVETHYHASGQNALWAGFTVLLTFTLVFGRAAYHSRSKVCPPYEQACVLQAVPVIEMPTAAR